jgi:hypothetical protein
LHAGAGTRPIRELHIRIENLEAPPKVRKRRFELPLKEQRRADRRVRPDETGRIVKPFIGSPLSRSNRSGRRSWRCPPINY